MPALVLITAIVALVYAPRLLAWSFALMISVVLIRRSRRLADELMRLGSQHRYELNFDRLLSRSERRLMRSHLQLALRQTELRSLLPAVVETAISIAD